MSSTSLVPYQAKKKTSTQPAIDNHATLDRPLDYSFLRIERILDAVDEKPRLPSSPRGKGKHAQPAQAQDDSKYKGRSVRLNNNTITNFEGFVQFIEEKFTIKENVAWIDLSQNELPTIGVELTEFENLQILYLHGNHITDINQLDQLVPLHRLEKLTLHGNPIENTKGYRSIVLTKLPQLKCLDFSRVTKGDRRTASFIGDKCGKKKKKIVEDED